MKVEGFILASADQGLLHFKADIFFSLLIRTHSDYFNNVYSQYVLKMTRSANRSSRVHSPQTSVSVFDIQYGGVVYASLSLPSYVLENFHCLRLTVIIKEMKV